MVMNTEAQRLPPHVIREMYAQSAQNTQLYGGRMTDKRLQVVTSVTTEAIETLHKYVTYHVNLCLDSSSNTQQFYAILDINIVSVTILIHSFPINIHLE